MSRSSWGLFFETKQEKTGESRKDFVKPRSSLNVQTQKNGHGVLDLEE